MKSDGGDTNGTFPVLRLSDKGSYNGIRDVVFTVAHAEYPVKMVRAVAVPYAHRSASFVLLLRAKIIL